jgi:hypothetical protein
MRAGDNYLGISSSQTNSGSPTHAIYQKNGIKLIVWDMIDLLLQNSSQILGPVV